MEDSMEVWDIVRRRDEYPRKLMIKFPNFQTWLHLVEILFPIESDSYVCFLNLTLNKLKLSVAYLTFDKPSTFVDFKNIQQQEFSTLEK